MLDPIRRGLHVGFYQARHWVSGSEISRCGLTRRESRLDFYAPSLLIKRLLRLGWPLSCPAARAQIRLQRKAPAVHRMRPEPYMLRVGGSRTSAVKNKRHRDAPAGSRGVAFVACCAECSGSNATPDAGVGPSQLPIRFVSSMRGRPGELGRLLEIQADSDPGPVGELNPAALKLSQYLVQRSLVGKGLVCLESV